MSKKIDNFDSEVIEQIKNVLKDELSQIECKGCGECDECIKYINNALENSELITEECDNECDCKKENLPAIELYKDNLEDVLDYDSEEFKKGLKEGSRLAGFITSLLNSGLTNQMAIDYIMNKEVLESNNRTSELNAKTQIKMTELQSIISEKNQI